MTTAPLCCSPDDTIAHVAELMREHDCGVIPLCADGALLGIVTDRDIACRAVAGGRVAATDPVAAIMTAPVFTVGEDADVQAAIDEMESKKVRRLPVVDDAGRVVGIIAPSDLAPIFASTNVADFLLAVSYWSRSPRAAA